MPSVRARVRARAFLSLVPLVLVLLACAAPIARTAAYRVGDVVPALERTQYKELRSAWTELLAHDAPRFAEGKVIQLHPLQHARHLEASQAFKISMSFDHDRYLLPWITVTDGTGTFLRQLDILFTYTGDHVVRMNYTTSYYQPLLLMAREKPDGVIVRYLWREHNVASTEAMATVWPLLLFGSLVFVALSIASAFVDHSRTAWSDVFPAFVARAAAAAAPTTAAAASGPRLTRRQRKARRA